MKEGINLKMGGGLEHAPSTATRKSVLASSRRPNSSRAIAKLKHVVNVFTWSYHTQTNSQRRSICHVRASNLGATGLVAHLPKDFQPGVEDFLVQHRGLQGPAHVVHGPSQRVLRLQYVLAPRRSKIKERQR